MSSTASMSASTSSHDRFVSKKCHKFVNYDGGACTRIDMNQTGQGDRGQGDRGLLTLPKEWQYLRRLIDSCQQPKGTRRVFNFARLQTK